MKKSLFVITILMLTAAVAMACGDATKGSASACTKSASTACATSGEVTATLTDATIKDGETVTFNVSNVTCMGCVKHITQTLTKMDGVGKVDVSLENGTAVVNYDPKKVEPKTMMASIIKAGYPTTIAAPETEETQMSTDKKNCDPKACAKMGCKPSDCTKKGD